MPKPRVYVETTIPSSYFETHPVLQLDKMNSARNPGEEALDELHEVRRALDARFDHDPRKFLAYLREYEEQLLREGWVEAAPPADRQNQSAV